MDPDSAHRAGDDQFRLAALSGFVSLLSASRGYAELLTAMSKESVQALQASSVSLSIWERDRGVMRTLVNVGELGPEEAERPVDEVYALASYPLLERITLRGVGYVQTIGEPGGDEGVDQVLRREGKQSCLGVPVQFEGRVWGELWATRTSSRAPFGADDLAFAGLVAAQVGAGIGQAEHLARVERLAYTDDLTGLANRRAFEDRLDAALHAFETSGAPVGVIVVDVNGLKRINDKHGHVAGDSALLNFAAELSAAASAVPESLAARLGGDEFCVLTIGSRSDVVETLAEDVCRRAGHVLEEGVACGVATTDEVGLGGITPARLLRAADAAQYRAKRSGLREPVVAGRQPHWPALAEQDEDPTDRRYFRGRGSLDQGQLLDALVQALDAADDFDPLARLEVVAQLVAANVDAACWWVSELEPGGRFVVPRKSDIRRRPGAASDSYFAPEPDSYPVDDYPATFAAMSGLSVVVDVHDPRSDPAETSLLMLAGMSEMVMCGGIDGAEHRWLVEILGDELSSPIRPYSSALRAGIALALHR